ncbi:hypothetical protein [Desulfobotulus mexicanus]|uniref:Uncharacterized protein n=1 Tax=Desulfobotulus mexicanus TaxID=2586642 RepID=A0A5S5MF12_9BACT|nr:hypothetical protein [Desulfobotulus mexicanus]TYT74326.1 hypothetical protein FIM25_10215 [Desulfobotulus mexicanus]
MKSFFSSPYQLFYAFLMLVSLGFSLFGVHVLRLAYLLEEPGYFILFFFSANFIILFSLSFALISFFRIKADRDRNHRDTDT